MVAKMGGSIVVPRLLAADDHIHILCHATAQEAEARIVGQVGVEEDGHVYGVAFVDEASDIWGLSFPPCKPDASGRALLACQTCARRELVYLTEIELYVYESNRRLSRRCSSCREWTRWEQAPAEGDPTPSPVPLLAAPVGSAETSPGQGHTIDRTETPQVGHGRAEDRRKHPRVTVKRIKACLTRMGQIQDVVEVVDVSRGGIRFRSSRQYVIGDWVQVAIPYTPGAANIFVSAQVVRRQGGTADKGLAEFGLRYVIPPGEIDSHMR